MCWRMDRAWFSRIDSAFLAHCVMSNEHHPAPIETMWAAQKPVLLPTGWLRSEPAKIEPSGKMTVLAPLEPVVCNRGLAIVMTWML